MTRIVRPVDGILAGYNLVLAMVWSFLLDQTWYAPVILAAHLAGAALPWLLMKGPAPGTSGRRVAAWLREVYPLLWLLAFWTELGFLFELRGPAIYDVAVAQVDLALFGVHWNAAWMPLMPQVWFSELMHFAYFAYYPLIFLPPAAMAITGRTDALGDMTLRLMVTYTACYLVYLVLPVLGPMAAGESYHGPLTDGFFYQLTHGAKAAGNSLGTAFPSSHVAGGVTIALLALRWLRPWLASLVVLEAVAVILATVYTQNHYAIDAAAGLLLAILLQLVAVPLILRLFEPAGHCRVPILPLPALAPIRAGGGP